MCSELYTFGQNTYLLEALNRHGAEFIVVGGVAVKYHCPKREADDLDLLVNPTTVNARRVFSALASIGEAPEVDAARLASPKIQIRVKKYHHADIVTPDIDFDFDAALAEAHGATINQVPVHIASRAVLIKMKSTGREKDLADTKLLERD